MTDNTDDQDSGEYRPNIKPDKEALRKSFLNGTLSERIYKGALPDIEKDDRAFRYDSTTGRFRV